MATSQIQDAGIVLSEDEAKAVLDLLDAEQLSAPTGTRDWILTSLNYLAAYFGLIAVPVGAFMPSSI
jgi:hypothetical protein